MPADSLILGYNANGGPKCQRKAKIPPSLKRLAVVDKDCRAPLFKKARGRPQTARLTAGEQRGRAAAWNGALQNIPDRVQHCSRCGQEGHNVLRCPADFSDGGDLDEGDGQRKFDGEFFSTLPSVLGSVVFWPFVGILAPSWHYNPN